jgi:hypothetical protein
MEAIFNKGKRINGNNATTGMGKASATHQVIINPATANTLTALASAPNGFTNQSRKAMATPASNEIILIFGLEKVDKLLALYFQDTILVAKNNNSHESHKSR